MTTDEVLAEVGRRGLRVGLGADGRPRLRGDRSRASPNLVAVLRWHGDAIVERLRAQAPPPAPEPTPIPVADQPPLEPSAAPRAVVWLWRGGQACTQPEGDPPPAGALWWRYEDEGKGPLGLTWRLSPRHLWAGVRPEIDHALGGPPDDRRAALGARRQLFCAAVGCANARPWWPWPFCMRHTGRLADPLRAELKALSPAAGSAPSRAWAWAAARTVVALARLEDLISPEQADHESAEMKGVLGV